jgi:DNA polymerase-3 subunit gamma/tau
MSQALYRKWRPRQWDGVIGQEHIIQTLRNAVRSGRVGHAYLFAGPRGTGKTSTARLLAKAMNCLAEDPADRPCDACEHCRAVNEGRFLDLIEIDAASNTSVDDVRDLRDKINFLPSQGRYKVYIIDEVHMLSTAAFNALLKTLEEPPEHAIFILATTEVHKIPATVLSRCQRHEFRRVSVAQLVAHLRHKAEEEGFAVDDDALLLIARQATGSVRDAISLLDQLSSTGERVTLAEAQETLGTATSEAVVELVEAVLARDAADGLSCIHRALDGGSDARQFARQMVDYLRGLLLVRMNNAGLIDATAEVRAQMATQAGRFELERLVEVIRLFNEAANDARSAWQPGLGLELALAEAVREPTPLPTALAPAPPAMGTPGPASPARSAEPPAPMAKGSGPALFQTGVPVDEPAQRAETPASEVIPADTAVVAPAAPVDPVAAPGAKSGEAPGEAQIMQHWKAILQEARKLSSKTQAVLNTKQTLQVRDGVLILGYSSETTRKMMEAESNQDVLRRALLAVLGAALPVRCVVVSERGANEADDADVASDGLVRTALGLGGKIVFKE